MKLKLINGFPLRKTETERLINLLRRNFYDAPGPIQDTIYTLRKSMLGERKFRIANRYESGIYFADLYVPQLKVFIDTTLGLSVFGGRFIEDAYQYYAQIGAIVQGKFVLHAVRHHVDTTDLIRRFYILELDKNTGAPQLKRFKLVPVHGSSHNIPHSGNPAVIAFKAELANARMQHLYELSKRPPSGGITLNDFRSKIVSIDGQEIAIWKKGGPDGYSDVTLNDYIDRWKNRAELYENHYPTFFNDMYKQVEEDLKLFKNEDPACQKPEFWYFFLSEYINNELFETIN